MSQIEGYALHIILVVFSSQIKRLAETFYRAFRFTEVIIHRAFPPPKRGVVQAGLFGLIDLDCLVDGSQGCTVLFAVAIDTAQEHPALNVVGRGFELFSEQLDGLRLILALLEHFPSLLEVVRFLVFL